MRDPGNEVSAVKKKIFSIIVMIALSAELYSRYDL